MDFAKLNTGELVELRRDCVHVAFAAGTWSLVCSPIGARYKDQNLRWVRTTCIAKRYTISEEKEHAVHQQ